MTAAKKPQPPQLDNRLRRLIAIWLIVAGFYELLAVAVVVSHFGLLALPIPGIATGPVSVMFVEETKDRGKLTPGQRAIFTSHAADSFLTWIGTHGEQDAAGAYRIVDKDDSLDQDEPKWQAAFADFKAKSGDVAPWMVVTRGGRILASEAMPADAADTMKLMKRYGGE